MSADQEYPICNSSLPPSFSNKSSALTVVIHSKPLLSVLYAAKADRTGAIVTGRHKQQFPVFTILVGLWKVPNRALRPVVAAAAQNCGSRMLVHVFICPRPHVPHHIHNSKRTRPFGMRLDITRRLHLSTFIGKRCERFRSACLRSTGGNTPRELRKKPITVSPWKLPAIVALCRILPFPFMRKALACPLCILASVLDRNPSYWFVGRPFGECTALPVFKEIEIVLGMVLRRIQKGFEFGIGDRILVDV